jgi:rSAM/selenodomain-associated transferase 2
MASGMSFSPTPPAASIAIIVPALHEAKSLPALIAQLPMWHEGGAHVVLVDGGSTDNTAHIAAAAGMTVVQSQRGRALQMNAGAQHALAHHGADILLFLHADTQLPPDALEAIRQHLQPSPRKKLAPVWGRFDVCIQGHLQIQRMLRVVSWLMNKRSRITGIATGDQAIFMTGTAFKAVGGFPAQPLMEDIEISKRLRRLSAPACIHTPVITSGRRWETHGLWRTIFLMWRLRWAYWRGVPASQLAAYYRPHATNASTAPDNKVNL